MKSIILKLVIALMATGPALFAQSAFDAVRILEDETGFGARALAMGGAYTGIADDYTAIYWNPAGLAELGKNQFFGEVSHLQYSNSATFNGTLTDESQNYTRLRSLGFAFPLPTRRGSFVIGVGYNRIKDFDQQLIFSGFNEESNGLAFTIDDADYAFDQDVYQTERISDEGGMNQWSIAAGMALSPNFTAGVTLSAFSGNSDYSLFFEQEDRERNYETFPSDFESYSEERTLNTDYTAVGMKIGGMFHMNEGVRIGGAIGFPSTFTVEEVFALSDELVFDDGFEDAFQDEPAQFEYDVKTPFYFDAGASFSNRTVTLGGSFRYRDWSQVRFDVADDLIGNSDFADLLQENKFISDNFRPTTEYRLGGEVFLENLNAYVRGGYAYVPTPQDEQPDEMNKSYISGGLGLVLDRFVTLDITYVRGTWMQESADELTPGGTLEDITKTKVLVGLNYRF